MKTLFLTGLALLSFAGNSVLCRLALAEQVIDPIGFTLIRLISGAITLGLILLLSAGSSIGVNKGSWAGGISLFVYAALFSIAYVSLDTATGALILFGSVQLSMLGFSLYRGQRFGFIESAGLVVSSGGLCVLLWPQLSTPAFFAAVTMLGSGVAWACYTIIGQRSKDALSDTTYNFIRCLPFLLVLAIPYLGSFHATQRGVLLAIASGAITSGIGYAIWYAVLPSLSRLQAGVSQLLVPALAAIGGVVIAGEMVTGRLIISSILILGGILMVQLAKPVTPVTT